MVVSTEGKKEWVITYVNAGLPCFHLSVFGVDDYKMHVDIVGGKIHTSLTFQSV